MRLEGEVVSEILGRLCNITAIQVAKIVVDDISKAVGIREKMSLASSSSKGIPNKNIDLIQYGEIDLHIHGRKWIECELYKAGILGTSSKYGFGDSGVFGVDPLDRVLEMAKDYQETAVFGKSGQPEDNRQGMIAGHSADKIDVIIYVDGKRYYSGDILAKEVKNVGENQALFNFDFKKNIKLPVGKHRIRLFLENSYSFYDSHNKSDNASSKIICEGIYARHRSIYFLPDQKYELIDYRKPEWNEVGIKKNLIKSFSHEDMGIIQRDIYVGPEKKVKIDIDRTLEDITRNIRNKDHKIKVRVYKVSVTE
jgi:hypothetical protein